MGLSLMLQSYFKKFSKQSNKKSFSGLDLPYMQFSDDEKVGVDAYKTRVNVKCGVWHD